MKPTTDPYRILGILRGADLAQIKTAHRRLAKIYHPDGGTTDEDRFLAVQEAYQLLSDPARRREWDRQHAPGPVRAPGTARTDGAPRPARRAPPRNQRRGTPRAPRPMRPPGQRKRTWSAEHVSWWGEFEPGTRRDGRADRGAANASRAPSDRSAEADATPDSGSSSSMDFDVFDRSSGAAWSSAARRHFRRGTDDLPSRGAWRYRGTQVVTGAEARKVAAEEDEERSRS